MMERLRGFLGKVQIYFIGNLLKRAGAFLLLPLYTRVLTPAEYGTLELVLTSVTLVQIFLGMNLGHAVIRFHIEAQSDAERHQRLNTLIFFSHLWCLPLLLLLMALGPSFSMALAGTPTHAPLFRLGFILLFFEVAGEIPLASLRSDERATAFVVLSGINLLLRVGLNIYTVTFLQMGIRGVLIGNILTAVFFWGALLMITIKKGRVSYTASNMRGLLRYSMPIVMAALPGLLTRNADKIFLGKYTSLEVLGLYALATRFRMMLEGFIIEPFNLGFGPFRFSILKREDAPSTLAHILTYYAFALSFVGLWVIMFAPDILSVLAAPSFRDAHKIIPGLIFVAFLRGVHYIFQSGLLIAKATKRLPVISTAVAALNFVALYLLTPRFGAQGAALALILSGLLDVALTYRFAQQVYPIPFDLKRIALLLGVSCLIYLLSRFVLDRGILWRGVINSTLLIFVFPALLVLLQFFTREDMDKIKRWVLSRGRGDVAF